MTLLLSAQAIEEIRDAEAYYELQQQGLGDRFKTTIRQALDRVRAMPLLYPVIHDPLRRVVVSRFPYSIFYMIDTQNDTIVVLSVAHQHREPFYTQGTP